MTQTDIGKTKFELMKAWAIECGEVLKSQFAEEGLVQQKTNHQDIVTPFDVMIETKITNSIKAHYPEDAIIGEESDVRSHSAADNLWIIDPIDGTVNFVNQKRHYAISVAYYEQGEPVFGIVYDVESGEMYHAYRSCGAFKNDAPLAVRSEPKPVHEWILASNIDWLVSGEPEHTWLTALAKDVRAMRSYGVVSLELCWIADRFIDVYVNLMSYPWDYGAGKIILEEAGGKVSNLRHRPLTVNETSGIICAAHESAIEWIVDKYAVS